MATAPMKSKPLHNFSLPFLKWGATTSASGSHHSRSRHNPVSSEPDNDSDTDSSHPSRPVGSRSSRVQRFSFASYSKQREDGTEKPQKQTTVAVEKALKESAVGEKREKQEGKESEEREGEEVETTTKPWNLRPRKATNSKKKGEPSVNAWGLEDHSHHTYQKQSVNGGTKPKSSRLREMVESRGNISEKKEKNRFWISLTKEEIEEDIFAMTGSRPARRPRKRPKNTQKHLDNVFPGLWLVGATPDDYRVDDGPTKK